MAHAYSIGKFESEAATNLMNHCDDAVVDALADLVKNLCFINDVRSQCFNVLSKLSSLSAVAFFQE